MIKRSDVLECTNLFEELETESINRFFISNEANVRIKLLSAATGSSET